MLSRWYYTRADGKTDGPVSTRGLKQLASAGRLCPGDRLRMDGKAKSVLAGEIEGLFPPAPREAVVPTSDGKPRRSTPSR